MKLTNSLTGKISLGYITIAIISILASVLSLFILGSNKDIDKEISEYSVPALVLYKDLNGLNNEIKRLCNSWIYTPNQPDKQSLQKILKEDYAAVQSQITAIIAISENAQNKADFKKTLDAFNKIVVDAASISASLATDEDYADDGKVDAALTTYEKKLLPMFNENDKLIDKSIKKYGDNLKEMQDKKSTSYRFFYSVLILMLVIILITGVISLSVSRKMIIAPINELKEVINKMGRGEITEITEDKREDEIGEMRKSIKSMITGFKSNTDFAIEIGKGNYDMPFNALSEKDNLGNALLDMRTNLKLNAENESRRSWATTGVANMGELLRKTDSNETELYDNIISSLIKYLGANQGGLFIVETDPATDQNYLELKSCYAYNRKKYQERRIEAGEGLVGQCYLEQETIYMTEVPKGYITITSGLGDANPNVLILVPLKVNNLIYGILEIASFNILERYHVEFIEKIAESIGSVISSVKMNQRTRKLLEDSQMQSEALRAQEEEMRQNMEELSATQEEMSRKEQEYLVIIEELRASKG